MAKIERASEDLVELFEQVKDTTNIPQWVKFEVLQNDKQKELYKIVKTNDVVEVLTEGTNFAVIFNEEIFDGLPNDMQKLAVIESVAGVSVSESDAVSLTKPDFCTHTGMLVKFGFDEMIKLRESVKSLFDEKKQREDDEKAASKTGKGRRGAN